MGKNRASKGLLYPPERRPSPGAERRLQWLLQASTSFVQPSVANRAIYEVLLEIMWPEGHGIPGPQVSEKSVREQLDAKRKERELPPYKDVFRRLRELQGEEGFTSIVKEGTHYQLQSLDIGQKREPRQKPSAAQWRAIKEAAVNRCAHCGGQEPDVKLSPDHRIPRLRGGDNSDENWQPLCEQCNNLKSSSCRGCDLNCRVCSWAFPETYKSIIVADDNKEKIRREAEATGAHHSDVANRILRAYFNKKNV